jgi:hypothetical protein
VTGFTPLNNGRFKLRNEWYVRHVVLTELNYFAERSGTSVLYRVGKVNEIVVSAFWMFSQQFLEASRRIGS